ncbi:MAG: hypothetical protein LUG60_00985 [Erysipelotrichaceae bacterium]|nr:hypothetical protein [Erysipelotrichaceae bacterium]
MENIFTEDNILLTIDDKASYELVQQQMDNMIHVIKNENFNYFVIMRNNIEPINKSHPKYYLITKDEFMTDSDPYMYEDFKNGGTFYHLKDALHSHLGLVLHGQTYTYLDEIHENVSLLQYVIFNSDKEIDFDNVNQKQLKEWFDYSINEYTKENDSLCMNIRKHINDGIEDEMKLFNNTELSL